MKLSETERDAVAQLLEDVPWGDFSTALEILELALGRALDVTYEDYLRWEHSIDEREVESEFEVDREEMRNAAPELRLAYIAQLLRTAVSFYGAGSDYGTGRQNWLQAAPHSPAALLRTINDIAALPVLELGVETDADSMEGDG